MLIYFIIYSLSENDFLSADWRLFNAISRLYIRSLRFIVLVLNVRQISLARGRCSQRHGQGAPPGGAGQWLGGGLASPEPAPGLHSDVVERIEAKRENYKKYHDTFDYSWTT